MKEYIINHFEWIIFSLCTFSVLLLCMLECLYQQKNKHVALFYEDSYRLFKYPEKLLNKTSPAQIDKDSVFPILKQIQTRKYYDKKHANLVDTIYAHLNNLPQSNHEFWTQCQDYYEYLIESRNLLLRREFIYFLFPTLTSLTIGLFCIKYSILPATFISNFIGLIGTIMVFYFGIPNKIDDGGCTTLALSEGNQESKKSIQIYKNTSATGLGLIAGSFLINLIIG